MDDLSSLEGLSEVNADVSELIRKQIEADKAAADELMRWKPQMKQTEM